MAPIPVYTESPINPAKASDLTPQTAPPAEPEAPTTYTPATTTQSPSQPHPLLTHPPPPQPGAVPRLPQPTGAQPPPPSSLPPPPRAGQAPSADGYAPAPTAAPVQQQQAPASGGYYPPQMNIPPPQTGAEWGVQRGTATAPAAFPPPTGSWTGGSGSGEIHEPKYENYPGYRQNVNAFWEGGGSYGQEQQRQQGYRGGAGSEDGEGEGFLGSAMKFAKTAGEKLSAAESEVWRRINGDNK